MGKKNKIQKYYVEHITLPLISRNINLIFSDDVFDVFDGKERFEEFAEEYHDGDHESAKQYLRNCNALVLMLTKSNMLSIILPKKAPAGTIAHEAFHLSLIIGHYKGLKLVDASEEAYAYMIQWLVDEIIRYQKALIRYEKKCKK